MIEFILILVPFLLLVFGLTYVYNELQAVKDKVDGLKRRDRKVKEKMKKMKPYDSVDEYIADFPPEIQKRLQQIRKVIKEEAPDATEKISYGIPTFYLNGNLVHFAVFKTHFGFFPTPSAISNFENELSKYKTSKGTIQFSLNEELPLELIREIVRFRIEENLNRPSGK